MGEIPPAIGVKRDSHGTKVSLGKELEQSH